MIINIRGTNGAGKTTVARHFISEEHQGKPNVDLCWYDMDTFQPVAAIDLRSRCVEGYAQASVCANGEVIQTCVVGSYVNPTGGMDNIPKVHLMMAAINRATIIAANVVCEGILSSTYLGKWGDFALQRRPQFVFAYLSTPLDECLRRIYIRQKASGKERAINEEAVANKFRAIASTRLKALRLGLPVYDLPLDRPEAAVEMIFQGKGDAWRAIGK